MADSERLLERFLRAWGVLDDLSKTASVLGWDMNTYMPEGGAEGRGQQLATLSAITHERLVDPALDEMVRQLESAGLEPGSPEAAMVRRARRVIDRATKLPASLVEALTLQTNRARTVWARAREDDDYASFAPELARVVELKREEAHAIGFEEHPYDALLDEYEPDTTVGEIRRLFAPLRDHLVALLAEIRESGVDPSDEVLRQEFDEAAQERFAVDTVRAFGYDFARGRIDRTVHPFATSFGVGDVRITTRYKRHFLATALFGTLHESGHAMYEQGIAAAYARTPIADAASYGFHESQSRLWENLVGRGRAFWEGAYPRLQQHFPSQLGDVPLDDFHAAINRVEPSFIRVEADEVTYNLHILARFELELAMIEGDLDAKDVPLAWNERYREDLGITPPDDALGCLQDVHWSAGMIGYFPTYTLGNLMSVQLFDAAVAATPALEDDIRAGRFERLSAWLREHVHRHGARYQPSELMRRATGKELDAGPYVAYLRRKFGGLYRLD